MHTNTIIRSRNQRRKGSMKRLILLFAFFSQILYPQQRYLVNKFGDAVPIPKGRSALSMIERQTGRSVSQDCGTAEFGYIPGKYTDDGAQYGLHRDVMAEWFEAPSSGSIDTIFWVQNAVCAADSTLFVRIFHSSVYTGHGPGWDGYPAPHGAPEVTCWGYYINSNDQENGIAAFPEDSTGPWVSTIDSFRYSPQPSFPPTGASLWGLQGYPVHVHENSINKVAMSDLAPLTVTAGEPFFITFRINGDKNEVCNATNNTAFDYSLESDTLATHDWKYYEYAVFGGTPATTIPCKGWVARGNWNLLFWYEMTPTTNTPPVIASVEQIHTTTSNGPQTFTCNIFDCDAANTAQAGVRDAWVRWSVDTGKTWTTAPLQFDGNDQYEYALPGFNSNTLVYYRVLADDSLSARDSSAVYSYKIVNINSPRWYLVDTAASATSANISATGTIIDTSQWFIAPRSFAGTQVPHRGDDGTAGPFAMNPPFVYYGDTMNFVWIGVDGAIALSKTAGDTIDVNANGFATMSFDFPYPQLHSRADTLDYGDMPKAFIAPYWADWVNKQDSPLVMFGHVRYLDDTAKFVAEWDGLGDFDNTTSLGVGDIDTFRVVLNKNDNSVEFQYDNIGFGGLDTLNLTGIQSDSNYHPQAAGAFPPYAFYNKNGYPLETHLHDGLSIRYMPVLFSIAVQDGWNLVSLAAGCGNTAKSYRYPTAISAAFIYSGGYVPVSSLSNGPAFWLKFFGSQTLDFTGCDLDTLSIPVTSGWNMIGSLSCPVPVALITADAGTGITPGSTFYGYAGGYFPAGTIEPGYGYWIRAAGNGYIHLACSIAPKTANQVAELNTFHRITISADRQTGGQTLYIGQGTVDAVKFEMPPRAPEGVIDARFASNRMVEIYPTVLDPTQKYEYPILISANTYPLTIRWEQPQKMTEQVTLVLKTEDGKVMSVMNGTGKITLNDASVKKIIVAVNPGIAIPKVFALGRNYPNPFNPTTRFSVDVPRTTQIEVSVYDLLGRKITTLWNGEQTAGYHTMEWDGRNSEGFTAPTGMYFIRMTAPAEQFSAVQKVLLMK